MRSARPLLTVRLEHLHAPPPSCWRDVVDIVAVATLLGLLAYILAVLVMSL